MSPLIFVTISCISFSAMNALVKAASNLPTWEIVFFRSFVNVMWLLPYIAGQNKTYFKKYYKVLLLRGCAGAIAMTLYFYTFAHMKLADAVMLNQSAPIWVLVFSAWLLKEKLSKAGVVFVIVAIFGTSLIIKPSLNASNIAGLVGLCGSLIAAVAYISIKIAARNVPPMIIVFVFASISSLLSLWPTLSDYVPPTSMEWLALISVGTIAILAQWSMTKVYQSLPASVASPLMLFSVLLAGLWGWVFWGEVPDELSFIGGIFVILALLGLYRYRAKQEPIVGDGVRAQ